MTSGSELQPAALCRGVLTMDAACIDVQSGIEQDLDDFRVVLCVVKQGPVLVPVSDVYVCPER